MLFNQTASPTGWTKQTGSNNVALRVVSGNVTPGNGVVLTAFTTVFSHQLLIWRQWVNSTGIVLTNLSMVNSSYGFPFDRQDPDHLGY